MMMFQGGQPPGPHAGDISPLTEALRPPISLTPKQCEAMRRLRRKGWEITQIANRYSVSDDEVCQALATMRTRRENFTRATLNVTVEAEQFVAAEAQDQEARWETMDRLLGELAIRRAWDGVAISKEGRSDRPT